MRNVALTADDDEDFIKKKMSNTTLGQPKRSGLQEECKSAARINNVMFGQRAASIE